jgi:hypothetical protein
VRTGFRIAVVERVVERVALTARIAVVERVAERLALTARIAVVERVAERVALTANERVLPHRCNRCLGSCFIMIKTILMSREIFFTVYDKRVWH